LKNNLENVLLLAYNYFVWGGVISDDWPMKNKLYWVKNEVLKELHSLSWYLDWIKNHIKEFSEL